MIKLSMTLNFLNSAASRSGPTIRHFIELSFLKKKLLFNPHSGAQKVGNILMLKGRDRACIVDKRVTPRKQFVNRVFVINRIKIAASLTNAWHVHFF